MDELRALRYFIAVAEDLNFTRAADRLGVAQPTLSRAIRALEDAQGVVLFERTSHRVELTEAGRVLADEARALLDHADRALAATRAAGIGLHARVRLGFVIGAANGLLGAIVRELAAHAPGVELELQHLSVTDQIHALQQRRLDVGLLRLPSDIDPSALLVETLRTDQLVAAVPASADLPRGPTLALTALRDQPFVFWPRAMAPSLYDAIALQLRDLAGLTPRIVAESRDTLTLLAYVAAGVGVTLITGDTAAVVNRVGVRLQTLQPAPTINVAIAHRPHPTPATQALIDACRLAAATPR